MMITMIMKYVNLYPYLGEVNGTPLQYSCLENPMDGGAWWAAVYGVAAAAAAYPYLYHLSSCLSLAS